MTSEEFEKVVSEALAQVPEKFAKRLKNVAILTEDVPSDDVVREEGLLKDSTIYGTAEKETLLGLYRGVPIIERGDQYGVGTTMPDTITLYRLPILDEAEASGMSIADVVRDTVWHEIAHHFGLNDYDINEREDEGTNRFGSKTTPSSRKRR